jgi:hypothetical protein
MLHIPTKPIIVALARVSCALISAADGGGGAAVTKLASLIKMCLGRPDLLQTLLRIICVVRSGKYLMDFSIDYLIHVLSLSQKLDAQ